MKKSGRKPAIPNKYNQAVFDFYEEKLNSSVPITKVAGLYNKKYGTNFAESTLRHKYKYVKDTLGNETYIEAGELEREHQKLDKKYQNVVKERHKLTRLRASVDLALKEISERELIVDMFTELYGKDDFYVPDNLTFKKIKPAVTENYTHVFAKSDTHLGYEYEDYYTIDEAIERTLEFYNHVSNEISEKGLKRVMIIDGADQIEGSALRKSQLMRIKEDMTSQANIWAGVEIKCLDMLSNEHPNVEFVYNMVSEDNHSQLRLHGTGRDELKESLSSIIANDMSRSIESAQKYGGMLNIDFNFAPVIITEINNFRVAIAHGHQFSKDSKQLFSQITHDFGEVDTVIVGHWHRFSQTMLNVGDGGRLQTVITMPAIIGDTDFGKRLHLSSLSGFLEIDFNDEDGVVNASMKRVA